MAATGHCPTTCASEASGRTLCVGTGLDTRLFERNELRALARRVTLVDGETPLFAAQMHARLARLGFDAHGGVEGPHPMRLVRRGNDVLCVADTRLPENQDRLPAGGHTALVVAGHGPHRTAVERLCVKNGLTLIAFEDSLRLADPPPDTALSLLHTNPSFRARFDRFCYVTPDAVVTFPAWQHLCAHASAAGASASADAATGL